MSKAATDNPAGSIASAPVAIEAAGVVPRAKPSSYPALFAARMAGREKRVLGDLFGLRNFGVNLTRLAPGAASSLRHRHTKQDEFIFVLDGEPTLITDAGKESLHPGMCAGFPAGGAAHHLLNETSADVIYLEIGDRTPGDSADYPDDDLRAELGPGGQWLYTHKDGSPW
ncbi:cupin domain-containing protein [Methylobacterium gnaphalii]|uniref:Cupin n=1 Tax=Methylobacterium gnaphalii TaxID=1010610 RepID=A0A512JS46_9HYPH|nr:cupin domain-containing protein [Methylobacterium gnaphalii]GEP12771.1 cupin [Methylobacterium gnaphalii]GJD71582.1 hypothetical protein MMMDOFMJ_4544 [Methylobacterium gnaphalii]GLS48437.1 cupin [Methylobacterium gnaphalii]